MSAKRVAGRIIKALKSTGPRPVSMLRGFSTNNADFERAIGLLFLAGTVRWHGKAKGRRLAAKTRR